MKIAAIARTKNEADIVEVFVRHTLAHVDHIYVQDNSEDATGEILFDLVSEGLPLTIIPESDVGDVQARNASTLMRGLAPLYDWIVPLDADEFCGPLRETLARAGGRTVRQVWRTYVYPPAAPSLNVLHAMTRRLAVEANPEWSKVIVPSALARDGTLAKGAHFLAGHEAVDLGLTLAHFPIRSAEHWAAKCLIHHLQETAAGWEQLHRPVNTHPGVLALLAEGRISDEMAAKFSASYFSTPPDGWALDLVDDPVPYAGGEMRYTKWQAPSDRLVMLLARFGEKMAREIARSRGFKTKDDRFNSSAIYLAPKV